MIFGIYYAELVDIIFGIICIGDDTTGDRNETHCYALIGAREFNDHSPIHRSRLGHEGSGPYQASGARRYHPPLPRSGLVAGVPKDPVIM